VQHGPLLMCPKAATIAVAMDGPMLPTPPLPAGWDKSQAVRLRDISHALLYRELSDDA
jgi:hypothetical protein